MRRAYILLAVTFALSACRISSVDSVQISSSQLCFYSNNVFNEHVTLPVEITEAIIEFDEYLSKSESDRELDTRFYGKFEDLFPGIYRFELNDENQISCTVETNEKSLKEGPWRIVGATMVYAPGVEEQTIVYNTIHLQKPATLT